jgi:LacI family transcriptional regulator
METGHEKAATLREVAKMAGVSTATVSRVVNNKEDIAPDTRESVLRAIQTLGYRRVASQGGRPPTTKNRRVAHIAFLVPDPTVTALSTPYTTRIIFGAERVLTAAGRNLILTFLREDGGVPVCLTPPMVDGVIIRETGSKYSRGLETAMPRIPCVRIFEARNASSFGDVVQPDEDVAARLAAEHLRACGRRHLAVWEGPVSLPTGRRAVNAFSRAARAAGADSVKALPHQPERDPVELLEESDPRPDGLFLPHGDEYLDRIYRALAARGLGPGGDLHLISCNADATRLRALDPRSAYIDIRAEEIGKAASELLLWRIEHPGEPRRRMLIEPVLVPAPAA